MATRTPKTPTNPTADATQKALASAQAAELALEEMLKIGKEILAELKRSPEPQQKPAPAAKKVAATKAAAKKTPAQTTTPKKRTTTRRGS